jgi:hypothetical protein
MEQQVISQEIVDMISLYLPFEKAIVLSPLLRKKLGLIPPNASNWIPFASGGNLLGISWL